ncbi:hypothetical protein HYALB_00007946 [Hymenoscyphus albidus]|uniref:Uncharacterized protein n=1 Tax=Hymenoscyphus albidus TaxID=595503 RepID=A0A9N9LPJ4_9HELO|nr:hypothetical protein HYALB_00007946 [Hymenoscyphus albidus]
MTSKAYAQSAFFTSTTPEASDAASAKRKRISVYDAVAGRISAHGSFIPKHPVVASTVDTVPSFTTASAPEEVLFRRKNAPTRFAEHDIYFANDRDVQANDLPESDLLKALHAYTSDFYSRASPDGGSIDWRSLDETALIALGILMEEASHLAKTSDLALTEGETVGLPAQSAKSDSRLHETITAPPGPPERSKKKRRIDIDGVID